MSDVSSSESGAISVFCFVSSDHLEELREQGDDGVFFKPLGALTVVFQEVDAADYSGERGERQMGDLTWLVPRVERHQEVIAGVHATAAVLPARFATLFTDWPKIDAWLEPRRSSIEQALTRLDGKEEWGVRCLTETRRRHSETPAESTSGSSYLMARKSARDQESARQAKLVELSEDFGIALESLCIDVAKLPVRSFDKSLRQADGDPRITLATWAALIDRSARQTFQQQVAAMSKERLGDYAETELSGPWPPYNFCPTL